MRIKLNSNNFTLGANARFEQINLRYHSTHFHEEYINYDYYNPIYDTTYVNTDYHDNLLAGKLSISYQFDSNSNVYLSISNGYKSGGINQNPRLSEDNRLYKPEFKTKF